MTFTEVIYGILFQPAATLSYLGREKPLKQGLILYLFIALFNVLISQGMESIAINETFAKLSSDFIWMAGSLGIAASIIMLFFMAGFLSLISEIIYGQANAKGLLVCLSFAYLPGVLGAPLQYAAMLIGIKAAASVLPVLVLLWVLVLQVIALREALALRTSQAVLLFIFPILILLMLVIASILVMANIFSLPFMQIK